MSSYNNFKTVIYCTAPSMESISKEELQKQIDFFQAYAGVDKVYLELYRDDVLVTEQQYEMCRKTFEENGILVAGGITTTISSASGEDSNMQRMFGTYCFSNEPMRQHLKETIKYIAAKFDELIIDDFFFTQCTCEDCISQKGNRSWADFRTEKMLEVSKTLVLAPAREVNPNIKVTIKFPNWRESYQETGYCPDEQKDIFDMIYTGTETRHPIYTNQNLPRYASYSLMRFMENTAPERNGGGWFDPYQCFPIDVYLEQAYLTAFSKPKEMMMFCWDALYKNKVITPMKLQLSALDEIMSQVGNCTGTPVYLPHRSQGEDHLEDYLGMAGIAFDPTPNFPEEAPSLFLTAAAHKDPQIMDKLEQYVRKGGKAIVTSGFMIEALGKGIEQMTSIRYNGRQYEAEQYGISHISGEYGMDIVNAARPITFPVLEYRNNATSSMLDGINREQSAPVMLYDTYGKGQLICLIVPFCFSEIKNMPKEVLTRIRYEFSNSVYIDSSADYSIFTYDNDTFAIYSYVTDGCRPESINVHIRGDVNEIIPLDVSAAQYMHTAGIHLTPLFTISNESVFELSITPGEFYFYRIVRGTNEAIEQNIKKAKSVPNNPAN